MKTKRLMSLVLIIAMIATMASFPAFAEEPALITGITVTGEGITPGYAERPFSVLVNGVAGEGMAIPWGAEYFISEETYDAGDGSSVLFSLYFDLGAKYDISRFFVGIGWDVGDITNADLYGSNDNINWTPVKTGLSTSWSAGFDGGNMIGVDLTGVSYQYFKFDVKQFSQSTRMEAHEISFTGTLASGNDGGSGSGGGTTPTPPPAGSGTEQKVALTADNITVQRYFPATDYAASEATLDKEESRALFVDGSIDTYEATTVWGNPSDVLETDGYYFQVIVDLGAAKDISKVNFHVGAENYGNWWQYAAPLNAEILVAGEDGEYTSVYTYEAAENEDYRLDTVTLDPATDGADVRYIKYTFNKINANPTIAEIEVYEMTAKEPTTYTVNYVDENGNPVKDAKVVEGKLEGDVVNETAPVLEGYYNVNTTESITLAADASENVITFNYIKKTPATYTVNYVDAQGNPVADAKTVDTGIYVDDEITEYAVAVAGYVISGEASATITLIDGENEITFVYDVYVSISGEHSKLTHLTGADVTTSVEGNEFTNLDNLFDGDTTAANEPGDSSGNPTLMNGYYGASWHNTGDLVSFVVDLGDVYELSEIGLYFGWAPAENPNWNNWQYKAPSAYTIYVADTLEGLDTAAPAAVVTGLTATDAHLCDSIATLSTWGRYVKIEAVANSGQFALREITFIGAEFVDPSNNKTVTFRYEDENGNALADELDVTKTTNKVADFEPIAIAGYNPITTTQTVTFDTDKVVTFVYKAIYSVEAAPAEDGTYSDGSDKVPFVFTVATPENIAPTDAFAAANWITENCEIVDVKVEADGMFGFVYAWKVVVTVAPTANKEFSVELDLPDEYELTDTIFISRTPSGATLDSAITIGENFVEVSTNRVIIELEENGMVKTDKNLRKVQVLLVLQEINEALLPYKGYDDVVIELKDIRSAGQGLSYNKKNFVNVGGAYVGELLAHKYGIDRLSFEIAIYGVKADGTKVELDTAIVKSEPIEVTAPDPKPTPTKAESISGKILPIDIITQLYGQVHPSALPTITNADWDIYKEVVEVRGTTLDIDAMRAEYETYRHSEPAGEYTDNLVIDVNKKIEASVYLWNFLKDIKVETITFANLGITAVTEDGIEAVNDIESVSVTFRNGIDYDNLNALSGGNFNLRVRINIDDSEQKVNLIGKAYNAVRRALNDDQLMPLFFRLDWYTWADLPFTGAVFTVKVSEKWIDNNGAFNLVAYHVKPWTYDYEKDNTPTIDKVQDNLTITPMTRELSFAVDGGSNGSAIYDTYVIVSTNKLPSELPDTID